MNHQHANHTFIKIPNEADPFAEIVDLKGRKMYLIINDDQEGEYYYRYKGESYYLPENYQISFKEIVELNK